MHHTLKNSITSSIMFMIAGCVANSACADVLLLYNQNLVKGAIVRTEENYVVRDDNGNVRYVPYTQVERRCKDAFEAYRWKHRRIDRGDVRGHIRLAQWCIQHDLKHEAANQLLHISKISPGNGAIRALERRLLANVHGTQTVVAANQESPFQTVAYSPTKPSVPVAVRTTDSLDGVPGAVVSEFKRSVQPIFVNRCGQAACHGSATQSDFKLSVHRNRVFGREMTGRNLEIVLSHLENGPLERSKLLKMARTPHGPLRAAPIGTHEFEMYKTIVSWAQKAVNEKRATVQPASLPTPITSNSKSPPTVARVTSVLPANHADNNEDSSDRDDIGQVSLLDPTVDDVPISNESSSPIESDPPTQADPFDPSVFNKNRSADR
ncbi:MAG: hypothetical protein KDB27_05635 [Planctomycetales bacterium]|nr:hypothetical protein [Planctomycetales bacterium]